jgi:hypothetical protein
MINNFIAKRIAYFSGAVLLTAVFNVYAQEQDSKIVHADSNNEPAIGQAGAHIVKQGEAGQIKQQQAVRQIDPMLPQEFMDLDAGNIVADRLAPFRLKAIAMNDHVAYCIINDQMLAVDDMINGYKVVKITNNTVILEDDKNNKELLHLK